MITKTTTEQKKVTTIVDVTTTETYAEALKRIEKEVDKFIGIDGHDCEFLLAHGACGCADCVLGDKRAPAGSRCLTARVVKLIKEAKVKAQRCGV